MSMPDVMIDLETMGTRPDAPILAIGAVAFDMDEGVLGERFYTTVDLASSVSHGARIDPATVMWWLRQGDDARAALQDGTQAHVNVALLDLTSWLQTNCAPADTLRLWGNGANFDPVILEEHFRNAYLPIPWKFWNVRCCRTLAALRPDIPRPASSTKHHALDDAVAQAEHLICVTHQNSQAKQVAPVSDGDERTPTDQQAADIARESEVLTDFGISAILNGDPVEFTLPELTKILCYALTQQKG